MKCHSAFCGIRVARVADLANRVKAARAYAGEMTQEELVEKLPFSLSTLQRIEAGGRPLRPLEEEAFLQVVGDATSLPAWFFTVDFKHEPPETRLETLENTVRELMQQLSELAEQADRQLKEGGQRLEEFGRILKETKGKRDG